MMWAACNSHSPFPNPHLSIKVNCFLLIALLFLTVFEFTVEVRAQFGVFRLDVDCHTEDAAGIDETFGEDAEDGFMDLSGGRYDETCDGKQEAADEHGNGRDDLHVFFCFFFHILGTS